MERLTKAEEEVMHMIWEAGRATVSQLIEAMPPPRPPHSTISSIVRILEKKGFVDHKAYGRTYEYYPLITKDAYGEGTLRRVMDAFFEGSADNLVSFLVKKEGLSLDDLEEIRKALEQKKNDLK